VLREADARDYAFDRKKVGPVRGKLTIRVTRGQVAHEWRHLLAKLAMRNPALHRRWSGIREPDVHPLFRVVSGPIEVWERSRGGPG
jgi:hypothetical protein